MKLGAAGILAGFWVLNAGMPAGAVLVVAGAVYWSWRVR